MTAQSGRSCIPAVSREAGELAVTAGHRAWLRQSVRRAAFKGRIRLSAECVEDLIQEVLLRLCQSGAGEKLETCPAYVERVAERTVWETVRRRRAQKRTLRPEAHIDLKRLWSMWPETPEEILSAREEFKVLVEWCRLRMSGRLFQTFSLVYLAGLPRREVGRLIGLSQGGVDTALYRVRQVLKEKETQRQTPQRGRQ